MAAALPLDEAQARLLALVAPLAVEQCPVESALGRYLAEPLTARRTQPAADLSAMDGYALTGPDYRGPWRVIGESAAGHPFLGTMCPGDAVRISTGALMPSDADTVLLQEDATREGDGLVLSGDPPRSGQHVRRAGFDFRAGDRLLDAGAKVTPSVVALAIACGHSQLMVRRRPRIAIIDSGDELSVDPAHCAPHQIPASNGAMLSAMATGVPCEIERIGPVSDDMDALADALRRAEGADLVVTSGGASVGDHDLVRPALSAWGAQIDFWKVAMKPGKPLMVARRGEQLILGLPGNPVSSYVTAYLFMLPLLRALSGASKSLPRPMRCPVTVELKPGGKRMEFLRAQWNGSEVTPLSEQDSSGISALAAANALIVRPIDAPAVEAGGVVQVYLLENGGVA
jgi:molybdopterin molybdotransferase